MAPQQQVVPVNGIELCYETFGDASGEPLLLVMGVALDQLIQLHRATQRRDVPLTGREQVDGKPIPMDIDDPLTEAVTLEIVPRMSSVPDEVRSSVTLVRGGRTGRRGGSAAGASRSDLSCRGLHATSEAGTGTEVSVDFPDSLSQPPVAVAPESP